MNHGSEHFGQMDNFEKRQIIKYFLNFANSYVLDVFPNKVLNYALDIIGQDHISKFIERETSTTKKNRTTKPGNFSINTLENINEPYAIKYINEHAIPAVQKLLEQLVSSVESETDHRLENIQKMFSLSETEIEVIVLFLMLKTNALVSKYLSDHDAIYNLHEFSQFKNHAFIPLGFKRNDISRTLMDRSLFDAGILEKFTNRIIISDWCLDYLCCIGDSNLEHEFFMRDNSSTFLTQKIFSLNGALTIRAG